jgi:hypothetical protein
MPTTDIREYPDFSWSHSRSRLLQNDCARRYYWHYYRAHLGWSDDAGDTARLAYRLKQLQSLPIVLGLQVHQRAREIAEAVREGEDPPSLEQGRERTRGELNRVWRASRDRVAFCRSPKRHPMLVEAYYGLPLSNDYLARVRAKMDACLTHLYAWPGWSELRGLGSDDVLLYEPTDPIEYQGTRLYAAPDLVYRTGSAMWEIIDWKTGDCTGAEDQLAVYGIYLRERLGCLATEGTLRGRVVRLDEPDERVVELTTDVLERGARRIRDSIWQMRGYLVGLDEERNEPLPRERFPLPHDDGACRWCPYFELCEMDLQDRQYFGPF